MMIYTCVPYVQGPDDLAAMLRDPDPHEEGLFWVEGFMGDTISFLSPTEAHTLKIDLIRHMGRMALLSVLQRRLETIT